jgi:glycosyltransferase involved in cell wall biosynthesis
MTQPPPKRPIRALMELRPAFSGHAGIPQETRLLFRGLLELDGIELSGLLQSSARVPAAALPPDQRACERLRPDQRINRLAQAVVTLQEDSHPPIKDKVLTALRLALQPALTALGAASGLPVPLYRFDPEPYRDFIWRALFAKTLPWEDFERVTAARYRLTRQPWAALQAAGAVSGRLGHALYPRFDTRDFDLLIGETPFPGRPSGSTRLVVRYHDAIPLLMPHTISERRFQQACHFHALRRNVRDGAWFACVSEATRRDLISIFPEVEPRAVTIGNMLSHNYFLEQSGPQRVPEILRARRNSSAKLPGGGAIVHWQGGPGPQYLLMVSTIEPRKNHLALLSAWEQLRLERHPELQLVLVGSAGWSHKGITDKFRPWLERGQLHLLEDVPAAELRLLYRHARVTVCPSFGEGFDYSGVEAMRCGGVVAASDIPVHREVYQDAALYFNAYSVQQLVQTLEDLLAEDAGERCDALRGRGAEVAAQYAPQRLLPAWQDFLSRVVRGA